MKILTPSQIYKADQATMANESITSLELMERVGKLCAEWIIRNFDSENKLTYYIFCGIGNNGGDGLAIARLLLEQKFNVKVFIVNFSEKRSDDFLENLERLKNLDFWPIVINESDSFPLIKDNAIIIDAIFGLGLKRNPTGFTKKLIQYLNKAEKFILSIDFPSGLYAEKSVEDKNAVINANHTLTFQCPKLAFLLPDNQIYTKSWEILDIGLDTSFIDKLPGNLSLTFAEQILDFYKERPTFSHKGNYGHTLLMGGSFGKIGAVVLALKAANKIGSGLVTGLVPNCGYQIVQNSIPEAMCLTSGEDIIIDFDNKIKANAIGIGMGMGQNSTTQKAFLNFIKRTKTPLVLDADALNCLAQHPKELKYLAKNTILTPHPKELERLIGTWKNDFKKLEKLKSFSKSYNLIIVLKGAFTVIVEKNNLYFNSTGNQALATGGTGDVLSGIITGLLAQHYSPLQAAILGVFIHGLTADIAIDEEDYTYETFIASDIIKFLPKAFKQILDILR